MTTVTATVTAERPAGWTFSIDRGGAFTDVIVRMAQQVLQ